MFRSSAEPRRLVFLVAALVLACFAGLSVLLDAQVVAPNVAPVAPLSRTAVPDVNRLGLLDGTGPNAGKWPRLTQPGRQVALQQLGKALFWDMQVGGDGVQACASCHYHAGADHRRANQMSPGLLASDTTHDVPVGPNGGLKASHFSGASNDGNVGFPVSETARIAAGATPDGATGDPGRLGGRPRANLDVNDVVGSQGVRRGTFTAVSDGGLSRLDSGLLAVTDPGFNFNFSNNAVGVPDTVRRSAPRNAPSVLNAVYHLRNFWDGRADAFFNGVNPLGFRDPDARVLAFSRGAVTRERLRIPFSSLASQAVGPVLSSFEMQFEGRTFPQVGRKLLGAQPLNGQLVSCTDSLLGTLTDCTTPGTTNRGLRALTYGAMVRQVFDQRFWGNGAGLDVCLSATGAVVGTAAPGACTSASTLMRENFALFFGLAVQAYEATLTSEQTIVDLVVGGLATGTITNGAKVVDITGLSLDSCVTQVALSTSAADQRVATDLCTAHYAKFIHPGARAGAEARFAPNPVASHAAIGGCANPRTCGASPNQANGRATLLNVNRGLAQFFGPASQCGMCHFNGEFTGATVSALTGFGQPGQPALPPGQQRKQGANAVMERMPTFDAGLAVYDSGFYNVGIRPTPEDVSLGGAIGGVPLSYAKLAEVIAGGSASGLDAAKIGRIATELARGVLQVPTSPTNLTPRAWGLTLTCDEGLFTATNCVPTVAPGERLQRFGAFKAKGLRNVKFTGPFFHNGAKLSLRQTLETYKRGGHFPTLNGTNLHPDIGAFALAPTDEAAIVELMETGLTDWRVAFEQGKFDHPELCVPHGHDPTTGRTLLAGVPAVGAQGGGRPLQTFEDQLAGVTARAHSLQDACTVPGLSVGMLSTADLPR